MVYSKPPFAGTETVLKYLARYTHRVALSNQRLVRLEGDTVVLSWQDYRHHGRRRLLHLPADELIRRFLQHVLPEGFVRIRYYGLFANRHRDAGALPGAGAWGPLAEPAPSPEARQQQICPICGEGKLRIVGQLAGLGGPQAPARERAPPCRVA